jgi:hypothetical protein
MVNSQLNTDEGRGMTEYTLLLDDARKAYLKVKLTFDMRDDTPVFQLGHEINTNMLEWSITARKFVRYLFEHGVTVHVAINHEGVVTTHLTPEAARRWLEDFPGEGGNIPRIESSQVFFR